MLSEQKHIGFDEVRLREIHQRQVEEYCQMNGALKNWGEINSRTLQYSLERAVALIDSGLIPRANHQHKKTILSVSANSGLTEMLLQKLLGNNYLVIANDLSSVSRLKGPKLLQSDASFLPFAEQSVHVLCDFFGAMWYEAIRDSYFDPSLRGFTGLLFEEYQRVLKNNGVVIFDNSTGSFIDQIAGKNIFIHGFVQEENSQFRIYRKK